MATIMARITRSGTLVGPGTKRKFRPGILGPGIKSSRSEVEAAERSRNKISYSTCGPMSSIRNVPLSNRTERILSRGLVGREASLHPQSPAGASIVRVTLPCQCYRTGLEAHRWSCALVIRTISERGGVASPARACARAGVTKSGPVSGSSRPLLVQATRSRAAVPFSSTASRFSKARCPMASRVSMVALPRCGSSVTFSSMR